MLSNEELIKKSVFSLKVLKKGFDILYLTEVSEQLQTIIDNLEKIDFTKSSISSELRGSDNNVDKFEEIIEVVSGLRWKDDRTIHALTWCKINNIDVKDAAELFKIVNYGEEKSDKSEKAELIGWRIPTVNELKTFIKHRKKSKDYLHRRVWCLNNNKPQLIGLKSFIVSKESVNEYANTIPYFAIIVRDTPKGLKFEPLDGFFLYKQLLEKVKELNLRKVKSIRKTQKTRTFVQSSGARRSSPKVNNTKFKTGMKYVVFHYAFGSIDTAPKDSRNFAMRGYIAKSLINPVGIKIKDFEVNDIGMINARYYIDSEIKRLGLDIPLHFKEGDYKFIDKYGPRMWIKVSEFKSGFEYDLNKQIIIDKYFDIADKYTIDNSFAKRIVIDTKPDIDIKKISAKMLSNVTIFDY